ncbi:fasciclin domain-containing protein [Gryllotalpicola reticulitermitis]|uniref:Fasciclin domain-containing protein n=1 Tax=Gryllotalpicola reticulitermitis TaxID=1184153 RepID=A0ABV8QAE0_9MICO
MRTTKRQLLSTIGVAVLVTAGVAGCTAHGSDSSSGTSKSSSSSTAMSTPMSTPSNSSAMSSASADLVGSGCAAYAKSEPSGPGSIVGMSTDPVAVAASNNPMLTSLVSAVSGKLNSQVNLVSTLDGGQFTVFAPVDSAFAKLPASTMAMLKTPAGAATLKKTLTYHVVSGQLTPDQIDGTHTTVEGAPVTVTGSGDSIKVDGANVICGGVHTANATVYLIDGVLTPPAS